MNEQAWNAAAEQLDRSSRWTKKGLARVTDKDRGSIVVPCGSPYSALLCAAEYWGCDWTDITGATVMAAEPGAIAVSPPESIDICLYEDDEGEDVSVVDAEH